MTLFLVFALIVLGQFVLGGTTYLCITRVSVERTKRHAVEEGNKRQAYENAWLDKQNEAERLAQQRDEVIAVERLRVEKMRPALEAGKA